MNRYLCCLHCISLQRNKEIPINLDELTNLRVSEIKKFIPPIKDGKVIKVYDGDTITIISKLPYPDSPLYKFSVRLLGIDCPEIKGKDNSERECAQLAKKELTELLMGKIITLENVTTEKYGRLLADVYLDKIHINDYLIKKRLAVFYDGTTKKSPKNWMDYYTNGEI